MISPARQTAFDVLLEMKRKPERHSDMLLHSKQVETLSALDKNLATTLVMGVLRWQLVLQQRIRALLTKNKGHLGDPVEVALELGALQLLLLDRIPARAAIFESVELVRKAGSEYGVGLVNAVLRKMVDAPRLAGTDAMAAHPEWMVKRWIAAYGREAVDALCRYDQQPPPATIRLLEDAPADQLFEPGTFVVRAQRMLVGEVAPAGLRIQDEGSQLIAELAGRGTAILDCCAAPGGKTAILAERNPQAEITACDISPRRMKAMQAMLGQAGKQIKFRVLDAAEQVFEPAFDLVLCDAPCSGTGTLARNPEIRHRLTAEDILRQRERQVMLLRSALRATRTGGRVVYSTCSLETEENESVVAEALRQEKGFALLPWRSLVQNLEREGTLHPGTAERLFPGTTLDEFLHVLPGTYPGDGYFAACLTRV